MVVGLEWCKGGGGLWCDGFQSPLGVLTWIGLALGRLPTVVAER